MKTSNRHLKKPLGSSRARRKRAHPQDALNAADIIAVTRAMARKIGFTRLSMRQIAARLGVTATALYYHFHNKNELLDKVSGHIMDSIEMPDGRLPWSERLRQVVLNQQTTMMEYPGLARFLVHDRESVGALRWMEMILAVLHDAGFRDKEMTQALATLSFFVHPFTLIDDRPHAGPEQMFRRGRLNARLKKNSSHYPCLTRLMPSLEESPFESYLAVALEGVIAGIAARLEQTTSAARRSVRP
jgi:AcrR family transcriptional regulator